jgi:hypothetical protein
MLERGRKGLGFGVGKEPLPSLFAAYGCNITATDISPDTEQGQLWQKSNSNLSKLDDLLFKKVCPPDEFHKNVSYRAVDMNSIPPDLRGFDFTWSSCAFEHLGSIQNGIDFILNQMECLKNGGWAVHTTEFNLSSNECTLEADDLVFFRRKDIERIVKTLTERGHFVEELDTSIGYSENDFKVDVYPYSVNERIRIRMGNNVSTSILLIIRK